MQCARKHEHDFTARGQVLREWKRQELHRDVRVAILQTALELLHTGGAAAAADVWTVLETAAADPGLDPLVKAVLLVPDRRACPVQPLMGPGSCGKLSHGRHHALSLSAHLY